MHSALTSRSFLLVIVLHLLHANALSVPHVHRQLTPIAISPIGPSPLANDPKNSFSDGGGSGFNAPAILWIVFAALLGPPLALAGVRGWRISSGLGLGLLLSFFIWCAFVNTTTGASLAANPVTSDLLLSLFVCGIFLLGVIFGALRIGILAGVSALGASGGAALGILIALLRPGLLVPIYAINIVPIGLFGIAGAALPIWHQRLAVIVSSSACGSFLTGLAIDLVLNKQSGMSQGIRYLLDRNSVHLAATLRAGYQPSLSTWIIVGVSIGLIPVFSYTQHRIFRQPFDRTPESLEAYNRLINGDPILGPGDEGYIKPASSPDGGDEKVEPQHIHMRFPSIIPSLPGKVDPRYTAQQQAIRRERETIEAKGNPNPNSIPPPRPTPAPGIGRMNFVPGWGSAVTAAKRVSTSFVGGARRMSTTFGVGASGAARRMSTTFGFGGGMGAGGAWRGGAEKRVSTLSVPSIYSVASRQNGYAPGPALYNGRPQQGTAPSGPQYDHSHAYEGMGVQLSPIRPLRLPNRPYTTQAAQPGAEAGQRNAPTQTPTQIPSRYAPSTQSGVSNHAPPPVASLRNNRNGWGVSGLPPSAPTPNRSIPPTPNRSGANTPNANRTELGYYGSTTSTPTTPGSRSAGGGGNRLKTATRYNLL